MAAFLLLVVQAAAAEAPPAPPAGDAAPLPVAFDLADIEAGADCRRPGEGRGDAEAEIVVCGRRERVEDYPMAEMERRYRTRPLVAEASIGGGASVRAYAESVDMGQGQVSKRAMVGVRLPL